MDGPVIALLAAVALWTAICLLIGLEVGWRTRGGYSPMPPLPPIFGHPKPKEKATVEPPKQEKI